MIRRYGLILLISLVAAGSAWGQEASGKDSLITWYKAHYPFVTMSDSIFTMSSEFELPDGFRPLDSAELSPFQQWIGNFPLWHRWKSVGSQMRREIISRDSVARVVHLPWRGRNNRDYAIPIRILAEWLHHQDREYDLKVYPSGGKALTFENFLGGELRLNRLGEPYFKPTETTVPDVSDYYRFMGICMDYLSYSGLVRNCDTITATDLRPGDLFVAHNDNGSRGCAYMIMQVLENADGSRLYSVATGCPKACDFHMPLLTDDRDRPWITIQRIEQLGVEYPKAGFFRLRIR